MTFKKGEITNPKGRPKNSKNRMPAKLFENFLDSMSAVEKDEAISKGKDFFRFVIERAYKSDAVAIAILRKLIPDQTLNLEEWRTQNPIKVTFETVETIWSAREAMVDNNQEGIIQILTSLRNGKILVEEAFKLLRKELLKRKPE